LIVIERGAGRDADFESSLSPQVFSLMPTEPQSLPPALTSLSGKVALVTGAGSGIGRAIAIHLAWLGATVYLVARGGESLNETIHSFQVPALGRAFAADLTDDAQVTALVAKVQADVGGIDVLIHSAAAYFQGSLETSPVEELDIQYRINLRAPYVLTQAALPLLRKSCGQILFINSTTGMAARPFVTAYAATKHGLKGMADSLRHELVGSGVRVVSIYPGQTATPMQEKRYAFEGRPYLPENLIQPEDVAALVGTVVCLPPTAEVTDLQVRPATKA